MNQVPPPTRAVVPERPPGFAVPSVVPRNPGLAPNLPPSRPPLGLASANYAAVAWEAFKTQESASTQKVVRYYKTFPCPEMQNTGNCAREAAAHNCFNYHSQNDRRRPPFIGNKLAYSHQICPALAQGQVCQFGETCAFSHNGLESLYHPAKYKSMVCSCSHERGAEALCPYAHSEIELRPAQILLLYSAAVESYASPMMQWCFAPAPVEALPLSTELGAVQVKLPQPVRQPELDLNAFKTTPCPITGPHNQKRCIYYHSANDRRRVPVCYSVERCQAQKQTGQCELGDRCGKSHNAVEQLYHPDRYKKRMCHEYNRRMGECDYGEYCGFAHSETELKVELLHEMVKDYDFYMYKFKTEWCPFNHEHNKSICVYAHNWQDYRRKLSNCAYSCELCSNWKHELYISDYNEGCANGFTCSLSHGWKEHLFHPHSYKTTACLEPLKCHKGPECPYFHGPGDRRYPPSTKSPGGPGFPRPFISPLKSYDRRQSEEPRTVVKRTAKGSVTEKVTSDLVEAAPLSEFATLRVANDRDYCADEEDKDSTSQQQSRTRDSTASETAAEPKRPAGLKTDISGTAGGWWSCPATPEIPSKKYGECKILKSLRLEAVQTETDKEKEGENEARDNKKLHEMLRSVGMLCHYQRFVETNTSIYDLMRDADGKCREIGIDRPEDIAKIAQRVKSTIENLVDPDSPSGIAGLWLTSCVEDVAEEGQRNVESFLSHSSDEAVPVKKGMSPKCSASHAACGYFKKD